MFQKLGQPVVTQYLIQGLNAGRPPLIPPLNNPLYVLGCELSSSNLKEFPVSIVERLKLWGDIDEVVGGSLLVLIDS